MRRRLWLAILPALLVCAPAEAATEVAREGELNIRAREGGGRLCITLRRERIYQGEACGRIPRSPQRPLVIFPDAFVNHYAAAVPPSVRIAESEDRRGERVRHRTVRARGFSARFVLIPASPSPVFIRFYGPTGRLLGIDAGLVGYIGSDNELDVFGTPDDGVDAHTEPQLAPTPDDPDRLITVACAGITNNSGGSEACDDLAASSVTVLGECEKPGLVGGIVGAGVAGVRLTLGSGSTLTFPALALSAAYGGRRAVGGRVPIGEAVRDAAAIDAAGAVVARRVGGMEPSGQPCRGEDETDSGSFGGPLVPVAPPPGAVVVASAGGESLLVADRGDTLCAALGALRARICPPPPVDSDRPRLKRRGRAVAGVLSRDAVRITLQLDRGRPVTVRTTDGPAYTGTWAGDLRFFAATVPARREVTGAIVRNRHGRIIGISARGAPRPPKVRRRVLAEQDGVGIRLVRREGHGPCVVPFAAEIPPSRRFCTALKPSTPIDGPVALYQAAVTVPCSPRRALAYGRVADDLPAPRVRLDGGRTVPVRRIALRGTDAWVAFLPEARVLGIQAPGRRRAALDLPPAGAQCGYSAGRSF